MPMQYMYPGGIFRVYAIPATAGNVVTEVTPFILRKMRWIIQYMRITLTTDATVANRNIRVDVIDSSGNILVRLARTLDITASSTKSMSLTPISAISSTMSTPDDHYQGINPFMLEDPYRIRISITNGQEGDSYSGYITAWEAKV